MNKPTFGQWCITHAYAYKFVKPNSLVDKNKRYPVTTTYENTGKLLPKRAMYIGFRVVHEGVTRLEIDTDDWSTWSYPVFERKCSKVVWVFVENERSKPFFVFPEDVEFEAET